MKIKSINSDQVIRLLRLVLCIAMVMDVLLLKRTSASEQWGMICGLAVLQVNDHLRIFVWKKKRKRWLSIVSLVFAILSAGYYLYRLNTLAANAFFVFPLAEMFLDPSDLSYILIGLHFVTFVLAQYAASHSTHLQSIFIAYGLILAILILFRSNNTEKAKVERLNAELQEANDKLQDYSANVHRIAVVEERTRIAQELHDAIGHGLVALGMNLEFADHAMFVSPEKAGEAVKRAHGQAKQCMGDLRRAVDVLRQQEPASEQSLHNQIRELFDKLQCNILKELSIAPQAENAPPGVKDCLFKVIREAVTNGLRHGQATFFNIQITYETPTLSLTVQDNGTGCAHPEKSHGLLGIEHRVAALGGTVYYPDIPTGFCLRAMIPFHREENECDSYHHCG